MILNGRAAPAPPAEPVAESIATTATSANDTALVTIASLFPQNEEPTLFQIRASVVGDQGSSHLEIGLGDEDLPGAAHAAASVHAAGAEVREPLHRLDSFDPQERSHFLGLELVLCRGQADEAQR